MAKTWNGSGAGYQFTVFADGGEGNILVNPDRLVLTKTAKGRVLNVSQFSFPATDARVEVVTRNGTGGTISNPAKVGDGYVIKGGETIEFRAVDFPTGSVQRVAVLLTTEAPA